MGTLAGFVAYAQQIADGPYRYDTDAGRCDPLASGYADCSGLVVAALRSQGVDEACTGSFALSRACHGAGAGIGYEAARATRGALAFIGANEGQGMLDGSADGDWPGHVAISCGGGITVEARNHNAGILNGPFDGRGWTWFGMPFWIETVPPATPAPPPTPRYRMYVLVSPNHPARLIGADHNPRIGPAHLAIAAFAGMPIWRVDDKQYEMMWSQINV